MLCTLRDRYALQVVSSLSGFELGEDYKCEKEDGNYLVFIKKKTLKFSEKEFSELFMLIKWQIRGTNQNGEFVGLACGPEETMPNAKDRKMYRSHGCKIYVDGKLFKQ